MASPLEDKILGEKTDYYCSSSDDDDEFVANPDNSQIRDDDTIPHSSRMNRTQDFKPAVNTGPKGVLSDWRKFKQMEAQKREKQDRDTLKLAKSHSLACRTQRETDEDEAILKVLEQDDDIMREFMEKRMAEMRSTVLNGNQMVSFGKLYDLQKADDFLNVVEKDSCKTTVIIHIYENKKLGLPAIQVYKNGDLVGNFIRLTDELGEDFFADELEKYLTDDSRFQTAGGYMFKLSEDKVADLIAVKQGLCGQRFELKINHARDHPLYYASASKSIVSSYQELSKRLALALVHEERRCQYLSDQAKLMSDCQEEVLAMPESCMDSPYLLMLQRSELAQHLKNIFLDMTEMGSCSLHINGWIEISYCIPEKVYAKLGIPVLTSESINVALNSLRPFHSFLLLEEPLDILASLPVDSSPALCRLVQNHTPLNSLQTMSADIDLPLSQVFMLVRHLVGWGKAIIIYPICESNIYVVSASAGVGNHILVESFAESFSGKNLLPTLAEFNPPLRMGDFMSSLLNDLKCHSERVQIIIWLLQRRLITQLHTYVYLCLPSRGLSLSESENCDTTVDQTSAGYGIFSEDKIVELKADFCGLEEIFNEALAICRAGENTSFRQTQIEEDFRLFIRNP